MGKRSHQPRAKSIQLTGTEPLRFFLIHGYTGSPGDFNNLPYSLHQNLRAHVNAPLMIGHGTYVDDLYGITTQDLIDSIEQQFVEEFHKGGNIMLGGHSFGGQIALLLASKYNVAGVFTTAIPSVLRFPFNIPGLTLLSHFNISLKKQLSSSAYQDRKHAFYYSSMPSYGLRLVKEINSLLDQNAHLITCPILTIHSTEERLASPRSIHWIEKRLPNTHKKQSLIFNNKDHGIFYSRHRDKIVDSIVEFAQTYGYNN